MPESLQQIAAFEDVVWAEAMAGMLRNEGVPVEVQAESPLPGLINTVRLYAPQSLAHRARSLLKSSGVSDAELDFAATGDLDRNEPSSE